VQRNTGFLYREKASAEEYQAPCTMYMYEAIIILQVQRNARLSVQRCDNYKITGAETTSSLYRGAEIILLKVQRSTRLPVLG
jgi:hypothetical protein